MDFSNTRMCFGKFAEEVLGHQIFVLNFYQKVYISRGGGVNANNSLKCSAVRFAVLCADVQCNVQCSVFHSLNWTVQCGIQCNMQCGTLCNVVCSAACNMVSSTVRSVSYNMVLAVRCAGRCAWQCSVKGAVQFFNVKGNKKMWPPDILINVNF